MPKNALPRPTLPSPHLPLQAAATLYKKHTCVQPALAGRKQQPFPGCFSARSLEILPGELIPGPELQPGLLPRGLLALKAATEEQQDVTAFASSSSVTPPNRKQAAGEEQSPAALTFPLWPQRV